MTTTAASLRDVTYWKFLTGQEADEQTIAKAKAIAVDTIDTSKDYAVVFTYLKERGVWDKVFTATVAGTSGLVAGGVLAGLFTGGVGWVALGAASAAGWAGFGIGLWAAPAQDVEWHPGTVLLPYQSQAIMDQLNCETLPAKQK